MTRIPTDHAAFMRPLTVRHALVHVSHALLALMLTACGERALGEDWNVPTEQIAPIEATEFDPPLSPRAYLVRLPPVEELPHAAPTQYDAWPHSPIDWYQVHALARAAFINDQRIEFSGQEATFGAEAVVDCQLGHHFGPWEGFVQGEFFINQPFDRNILVDTPERRSYRGNFEIDVFEIQQLFLAARLDDFTIALGKMVTPFGRAYFPLRQNNRQDAPFIRTESILWRETGLLLEYHPGPLVLSAGLMNGGFDRDTNSSKAIVSRIGFDTDVFSIGASVKWQDGIGSEGQKQHRNHVGADVMFRRGPVRLSAEAIYDEYGFRREAIDPLDITWGRSIYYRDQNIGYNEPITGYGYYVNLDILLQQWELMLNYGEFYPEQIGMPQHDVTTRRGILKAIYHFTPNFESFTMVLIENDVPNAQANRLRRGVAVLSGFQFAL